MLHHLPTSTPSDETLGLSRKPHEYEQLRYGYAPFCDLFFGL
jgi:hypothetical protein